MDRRTFFRISSEPFNNVPSQTEEPAKELSSLDKAHVQRASGKGSLLSGGALMGCGVMVAGHEITTGSVDDPLQIAVASLMSITLLISGRSSYKEGSARLDLAHEYAVKAGIEKATAIKVASEVETTPIEPPVKQKHLYLVK